MFRLESRDDDRKESLRSFLNNLMAKFRSSFYSRYLFPRLCDWALDQPFVARHRREQLAQVRGEVLEIGVGTGLNLPCYPPTVRRLTVVEPNFGMSSRLRRRIKETAVEVDQRITSSESLPFQDCSFDFVVSTFTLCSIQNVEQALREMYRVVRPGGRFVFLEHGLSPEPKVQKWQRRLNWIQGIIGDGCRLDIDVRQLVVAATFHSIDIENFYLEHTPRTHGYLYRGSGVK